MHQKQILFPIPCHGSVNVDVLEEHVGESSSCLTRDWSSGAQNAEHRKSRAIIIRAVLPWTLMAVPILLPQHIQRPHLGLKGVNT